MVSGHFPFVESLNRSYLSCGRELEYKNVAISKLYPIHEEHTLRGGKVNNWFCQKLNILCVVQVFFLFFFWMYRLLCLY